MREKVLNSQLSTNHVDDVIVAALANVHLVQLQLLQEQVPLVLVDVGRRIHDAPVTDDQAVLAGLFSHAEISVLNGDHCANQVFLKAIDLAKKFQRLFFQRRTHLEVPDLLLVELAEGDAARHEDGGGLGHPKNFPALSRNREIQFGDWLKKCKTEKLPDFRRTWPA